MVIVQGGEVVNGFVWIWVFSISEPTSALVLLSHV